MADWSSGRRSTASASGCVREDRAERLQAVLPLARPGQGAGPPLDEFRVAVAGRDLCTDLVSVDVFAETDEGTAGCPRWGGVRAETRCRPHDRQRRHRGSAGRVQHRDEDAVAPLDGGARRQDQVEVRCAVADDHEVDVDPLGPAVFADHDGPGHTSSSEDPAERWRRDALDDRGPGVAKRRIGGAKVGSITDEQRALARQHAMACDEIDHPVRPHHTRAIGAADRRDPLVRAGRGEDRSGADRPQRGIVDRGHDALVPADGRRAVEEPDVGVTRARATGDRFQQRDADAAVRRLVRRGDARSAPAHDEHIDLEVDRHARPGRRGARDR